MKALKINQIITTKSGIAVPSGAVIVITEAYADIKEGFETEGKKYFPCTVAFNVFANEEAFEGKKNPISDLEFPTTLNAVPLGEVEWNSAPAATMLIAAVKQMVELVLQLTVEEIEL